MSSQSLIQSPSYVLLNGIKLKGSPICLEAIQDSEPVPNHRMKRNLDYYLEAVQQRTKDIVDIFRSGVFVCL